MIYCAVSAGLFLLKGSLKQVWVWLRLPAFIEHQPFYGCRVTLWRSHSVTLEPCTLAECPSPGNSWSLLCCCQLFPRLASLGLTPRESQSRPECLRQHCQSIMSGLTNRAGVRLHLEGDSSSVPSCLIHSVHSSEKLKSDSIFFCTVMVKMGMSWLFWSWLLWNVWYSVSASWNSVKSRLWKECGEKSCLEMLSEAINC